MKRLLILSAIFLSVQVFSQTKLPAPKCTVLSGKSEGVSLLFDSNVETGWFPGWDASKYPVRVQLDFGEPVVITKVRFYDGVGKPTITLSQLNGTTSVPMLSSELGLYMAWQEREVNTGVKSQYVILSISDIQGDIPLREVEFFGGKDVVVPPPTPPIVLKNLTGDARKLGMNGFHWIPNDLLIFPNIRVYQMSQWTWTTTGIMPDPSFQANANYDKYFKSLKDLGVTAIPCINTIPNWMGAEGTLRMCYPSFSGNNPEDYIDIAQYVWQYTARYGSKTYPQELLKVNQTPRWNGDIINEKKSGLNLLTYVEFENEPDRPWNDPLHKYTPEQMAAFMSAIWDGNEGKMGKYVGVKNADPNVKVVLPGLAEINVDYLERMRRWFETNRKDKRFCADVINVHHYSNSSNPKWPSHSVNLVNGRGICPESDLLDYRLKDLRQYVSQYLPSGTEVWFSEFGYDTQPPQPFGARLKSLKELIKDKYNVDTTKISDSTMVLLLAQTTLSQCPLVYSNHTPEELQSWWLQRIFLIGLSSGMDRLFLYNGIDENNASTGNLFASSGILYGQVPSVGTSFGKKPSYTALQSLVKNLDGFTFNADKSVAGVTILEFKKGMTKRYFYWCPTANDSKALIKIGNKNLVATECPQVFTPKWYQRKDVDKEYVLIQVESD